MRKGIKYKDTTALPGSELYKLLVDGKDKEAERCYRDTNKREQELMTRIDAQMARINTPQAAL